MNAKKWLLMLTGLIVVVSMIVSCTPSGAPTTTPSGEQTPQVTTAPAGETTGERVIRVRYRGDWSQGFNDFTGALWFAQGDIYYYFYMPLAIVVSETTPKPWLAQSWEIGDQCETLTIHLYPDATWSDGVPITTADVQFTFERLMHPDVTKLDFGLKGTEEFWADPTSDVAGIVIIDDQTLRLEYREGRGRCWPFEEGLEYYGIVPQHIFENIPVADLIKGEYDEASNPSVVSGPFNLGQWEKNVYFEAIARTDWWGTKYYGEPKVDKIIAVTSGDSIPALVAGDVDIVQNLPLTEIEGLSANENLTFPTREGLMMTGIQYNMRPDRMLPDKIRYAIDYATDRDAIVQAYTLGQGSKVYSFFSNEGPYADPTIEWRDYDPEQAKQLIQEAVDAGEWDADREIAIVLGSDQPHFNLWLEQLKAVGLNATIEIAGPAADQRTLDGDYDITMMWGGAVRGHPERACAYWLEPGGYWFDRIGFYSEEFAGYCKAGMGTTDEAVRQENFANATRIFVDHGPWVTWTTVVITYGVDKKVCGVVPSGGHPLIHRAGENYGLFDWYLCDQM